VKGGGTTNTFLHFSFQKMSRIKKIHLRKKLCKWFNLWGEVTNTILPSLLLKFEYIGQKQSYVKGGFLWVGWGKNTISFEKNHI
jgi:hypothetical protein